MKKFLALVPIILIVLSCKENIDDNECSCNDVNLAISYSIAYSKDSTNAIVCASDASNNVPAGSTIDIKFNGGRFYNSPDECYSYDKNGKYSLNLSVVLPNGLKCSKTEEFEIKSLK